MLSACDSLFRVKLPLECIRHVPGRCVFFLVAFLGAISLKTADELQADSSPLKPGERRALSVRVHGSTAKVSLEARNLAPRIAELVGGNVVRASSTGGTENVARFHLPGRKNGSFAISIRLVPSLVHPQ